MIFLNLLDDYPARSQLDSGRHEKQNEKKPYRRLFFSVSLLISRTSFRTRRRRYFSRLEKIYQTWKVRIADVHDSDRSARVTQQQQIDWFYFLLFSPALLVVYFIQDITNLQESFILFIRFFLPFFSSYKTTDKDGRLCRKIRRKKAGPE